MFLASTAICVGWLWRASISFAAMARSLLGDHSVSDIIPSRSTAGFDWRQKGGVVPGGRRSSAYRPRDKGLSHSAVSGSQVAVKSSSIPSQVRLTPSTEGLGSGSRKLRRLPQPV